MQLSMMLDVCENVSSWHPTCNRNVMCCVCGTACSGKLKSNPRATESGRAFDNWTASSRRCIGIFNFYSAVDFASSVVC